MLSGAAVGALSLALTYPFEVLHTQVAADVINPATGRYYFDGALDALQKTVAVNGITGLFRGLPVTVVGVVLYRSLYFGLYDSLFRRWAPKKPRSTLLMSFLLTSSVGVMAGFLTIPLDTIRRRMILDLAAPLSAQYRGAWDCTVQIVSREGWSALFHGAAVHVLRSFFGSCLIHGIDLLRKKLEAALAPKPPPAAPRAPPHA